MIEGVTPIPSNWVDIWQIEKTFSKSIGIKSDEGLIEVIFKNKTYKGVIYRTKRRNAKNFLGSKY